MHGNCLSQFGTSLNQALFGVFGLDATAEHFEVKSHLFEIRVVIG
jgi:hypothetical protein